MQYREYWYSDVIFGICPIINGLNHIKMSQQIDSNGFSMGNKTEGILSMILGLVIIIADIIKLIL